MLATLLLAAVLHLSTATCYTEGCPVSVVGLRNKELFLDEETIHHVLEQIPPDTAIAVIGIAGPFRQGKSFLMNFFLQYMKYRETHPPTTDRHQWMEDIARESGFQFKSGSERETEGLDFWSHPFLINDHRNQSKAVLVVDSQGLYDENTEPDDNVRLFSSLALISSGLMWNCIKTLDSRQLEELTVFTKFANVKSQVVPNYKPFQRITFVFRDSDAKPAGAETGQQNVDQFLKPTNARGQRKTESVIKLASQLKDEFDFIDGFTIPYPGSSVTESDFSGKLNEIDDRFLDAVNELVTGLIDTVSPRRLLYDDLKPKTFAAHFNRTIASLNSGVSPSEMLKMEERDLISQVDSIIIGKANEAIAMLDSEIEGQANE